MINYLKKSVFKKRRILFVTIKNVMQAVMLTEFEFEKQYKFDFLLLFAVYKESGINCWPRSSTTQFEEKIDGSRELIRAFMDVIRPRVTM